MTAYSTWCKQPLQLSGVLDAARWGDAGVTKLPALGYMLVQNDGQFLYVGLDIVEDLFNDTSTNDYFWLSFDVNGTKTITPNVDVNYAPWPGQPNHLGKQFYLGPSQWTGLQPNSGACECHEGFGASLKSATPHRMWELKLPLADIGGALNVAKPQVRLGLRVHSKQPGFTTEIPPGFTNNFAKLVPVMLMKDPAALLSEVLTTHPQVAAAIEWQATPADPSNVYVPPTSANMLTYANWSAQQQADLRDAFQVAVQWLMKGAPSVPHDCDGLTDPPVNTFPQTNLGYLTVTEQLSLANMWQLYVHHVAFSLAQMASIVPPVGFSLAGLTAAQLRYMLSSTTMGWNLWGTDFMLGTYSVYIPALRADNLPKTNFAPPRWVYSWLRDNQLIAPTRLETIERLLDWMRQNLWHFFGSDTFDNCDAIWQYRGYPPLSRMVAGTVDANNPGYGAQHWTLGCHGSVGFLHAMLRVLNIPVQPVWVCGHELAYFMTEGLYLDHGDDPYNQNVKNSAQSIALVFIDEATYATRFSPDATVNITGQGGAACSNVGLQAQNFPP